MNVLEDERSCLRFLEISINVNIIVYIYFGSVVCGFLFTCLPFCAGNCCHIETKQQITISRNNIVTRNDLILFT